MFLKNKILRLTLVFFFLTFHFLLFTSHVSALSLPDPTGLVNDFAGVLSSSQKDKLENELLAFKSQTTIEFTVVTVKSLEGTTTEDYAARLFEKWKIGKKGPDNGLLLLVAPNERKVKFEVGYGLESQLNDARAGRLLDTYLLPEFRQGKMAEGIVTGTEATLAVLKGEADIPPSGKNPNPGGSGNWFYFLVLPLILFQYLGSFLARSKSIWAGGIMGALAGLGVGFFLHSLTLGFASVTTLTILGFLLDYILSTNYQRLKLKGHPNTFWTSWGGFYHGGFGGDEGFGGFGGGGSGGGGAGRSW